MTQSGYILICLPLFLMYYISCMILKNVFLTGKSFLNCDIASENLKRILIGILGKIKVKLLMNG